MLPDTSSLAKSVWYTCSRCSINIWGIKALTNDSLTHPIVPRAPRKPAGSSPANPAVPVVLGTIPMWDPCAGLALQGQAPASVPTFSILIPQCHSLCLWPCPSQSGFNSLLIHRVPGPGLGVLRTPPLILATCKVGVNYPQFSDEKESSEKLRILHV